MIIRKLQKLGGGTLYVSLPKEWVVKHGLKNGDSVILDVSSEGIITISPIKVSEKIREAMIEASDLNMVARHVLSKYLSGYEIIKIVFKKRLTSSQREIILKEAHKLVGLEVVDEGEDYIMLQSLVNLKSIDPRKLIQRMNNIAGSIYRDAFKALVNNNNELAELAAKRDEEVNRSYFLIVRALRTAIGDKKLLKSFKLNEVEVLDFRLAVSYIEAIGDVGVELAEIAKSIVGSLDMELIKKLYGNATLLEHYQKAVIDSLFKRDSERAVDIKNDLERIKSELSNILKSGVDNKAVDIIIGLIRICELIIDITDLIS